MMSQTTDLGTRIELVSMDPHFQDITIGLYEQEHDGKPYYLVHTYSTKDGATERISFLINTMKTLGGLGTNDQGAGH